MIDHRNYTHNQEIIKVSTLIISWHNLSSWEKSPLKKIQADLNFIQALLSFVYNCDDQSYIHIFLRSSNIWTFMNCLHI